MERITKHEQDGTVNFETCKPWSKSGGPGTKKQRWWASNQVVHMMCVTVSGCSFFLSSPWGYNDCPPSCRALAQWFCAPRLCPETLGNDPLSSTRLRSIPRTRSGCLTGHPLSCNSRTRRSDSSRAMPETRWIQHVCILRPQRCAEAKRSEI